MSNPVPSYSYGRRVSARPGQKIWNGQYYSAKHELLGVESGQGRSGS